MELDTWLGNAYVCKSGKHLLPLSFASSTHSPRSVLFFMYNPPTYPVLGTPTPHPTPHTQMLKNAWKLCTGENSSFVFFWPTSEKNNKWGGLGVRTGKNYSPSVGVVSRAWVLFRGLLLFSEQATVEIFTRDKIILELRRTKNGLKRANGNFIWIRESTWSHVFFFFFWPFSHFLCLFVGSRIFIASLPVWVSFHFIAVNSLLFIFYVAGWHSVSFSLSLLQLTWLSVLTLTHTLAGIILAFLGMWSDGVTSSSRPSLFRALRHTRLVC